MMKVEAKFCSVLVDNFNRFGPLRGIAATFNDKSVEGIIVDHFTETVECNGLKFQDVECLEIVVTEPTMDNVEALSIFNRKIGETASFPICLLADIDTWDI